MSELKNETGFIFYFNIGNYNLIYSEFGFEVKAHNGDVVFSFEKEQILDNTVNPKKAIIFKVGYIDRRKL